MLTRKLAAQKHFPAIDALESVSRVRDAVIDGEHLESANLLLRLESAYRQAEDLIAVGAYKPGADKLVDAAITLRAELLQYVRQRADDGTGFGESRERCIALARRAQQLVQGAI